MVFEFPCDIVELLSKLFVLVYSIGGDLINALCLLFGKHAAALFLQLCMVVEVSSSLGKGGIALRLLFDEIFSDAILFLFISDFIPILTKYFPLVADEIFFVFGITSFKSKPSH